MEVATDVAVFTCIRCPLGCLVEVAFAEDGGVAEVLYGLIRKYG